MRVAVSNSGPLIHLTLAGLLDLVFELYDLIVIPPSVYDEIIVKGKEQGQSDAFLLERFIINEKIKVKEIKKSHTEITSSKLHEGEINAIILSLQSNIKIILLDDEEARIFARKLGITVSGTLGILIELFKRNLFGLPEALQYLKKINEVMYLSSDLYCFVEDALKDVVLEKKNLKEFRRFEGILPKGTLNIYLKEKRKDLENEEKRAQLKTRQN